MKILPATHNEGVTHGRAIQAFSFRSTSFHDQVAYHGIPYCAEEFDVTAHLATVALAAALLKGGGWVRHWLQGRRGWLGALHCGPETSSICRISCMTAVTQRRTDTQYTYPQAALGR